MINYRQGLNLNACIINAEESIVFIFLCRANIILRHEKCFNRTRIIGYFLKFFLLIYLYIITRLAPSTEAST